MLPTFEECCSFISVDNVVFNNTSKYIIVKALMNYY